MEVNCGSELGNRVRWALTACHVGKEAMLWLGTKRGLTVKLIQAAQATSVSCLRAADCRGAKC